MGERSFATRSTRRKWRVAQAWRYIDAFAAGTVGASEIKGSLKI